MIERKFRLMAVPLATRVVAAVCLAAASLTMAGPAAPALAQGTAPGQSRCGTVTVGQSVATLGQTLSATAVRGGGWSSSCGGSWAWGPALPVGKVISGCGQGDRGCRIKVTAPTGTAAGGYSFLGFCISGVGGLQWSSCGVYSVVPKGAVIEGYTKSPAGAPVPGVDLMASGPGGRYPALTSVNGEYVFVVNPGTYKVWPVNVRSPDGAISTAKVTFDPQSVDRTAIVGRPQRADFTVAQQNTLSIQLNPAESDASGLATVQVTITDTSPGTYGGPGPGPVVGAKIVVEPPVEVGTDGVANGLLCDSAGRLVSPVRLHDGSLLGTRFWATTDSAGQVTLTLYLGTLSGRWVIDAYQPGPAGAPLVSQALTVAAAAGRTVLDPDGDLLGQLIATGDSTLLQKGQSLQRNVLEWLGEVNAQLQSVNLGVGYAPIYGVDASGATNAGVVLFAPSFLVRQSVLNYLDRGGAVPTEDQAWVIDIGNLSKLLATGQFTGNMITHVQYRLPSLQVWEQGEKVMLARGEDKAIRSDVPTLVPVAGRVAPKEHAHFGLVGPKGNEDMLYGYGPYLPAPGTSAAAVALAHCVGA